MTSTSLDPANRERILGPYYHVVLVTGHSFEQHKYIVAQHNRDIRLETLVESVIGGGPGSGLTYSANLNEQAMAAVRSDPGVLSVSPDLVDSDLVDVDMGENTGEHKTSNKWGPTPGK